METICKIDLCTGCGACAAVCPQECISLKPSAEGFLYPSIDDRLCIDCGRCASACPGNSPVAAVRPAATYAGWSRDEIIRTSSSSGGAFYSLAESMIQQGGVVFGAVLCDDLVIRHIGVDDIRLLAQMRGSKYAQSEMGNTYALIESYLSQGRKVLFSGTPCQVAGLRSVFGLREGLVLVDIVCHGVPSVRFFHHYLEGLGKRYPDIDERSFQFRTLEAWNAIPNAVVGGERVPLRGHDSIYTKLFLKNLLHRESCYRCPYACAQRVSDITIADFWEIGAEDPFEYDTSRGCSLVLVNTPVGEDRFALLDGTFFSCARALSEAVAGNAQLRAPSERPDNRTGIYDFLFSHTLDEIEEALLPKKK